MKLTGARVAHRGNPSWTGRVLRVERYPGVAAPQATVIWSWAMSARRADPRDLVVIESGGS